MASGPWGYLGRVATSNTIAANNKLIVQLHFGVIGQLITSGAALRTCTYYLWMMAQLRLMPPRITIQKSNQRALL